MKKNRKPVKIKLTYGYDDSVPKEEAEENVAAAFKILFDEVLRRRREEQACKEGS